MSEKIFNKDEFLDMLFEEFAFDVPKVGETLDSIMYRSGQANVIAFIDTYFNTKVTDDKNLSEMNQDGSNSENLTIQELEGEVEFDNIELDDLAFDIRQNK